MDDELFFDGDVEDEVARQGERRPPMLLLRDSDRDEKEDLAEMQECFVLRLVVASAKQEVPPFLKPKPPPKPRAKGKEVL